MCTSSRQIGFRDCRGWANWQFLCQDEMMSLTKRTEVSIVNMYVSVGVDDLQSFPSSDIVPVWSLLGRFFSCANNVVKDKCGNIHT